MVQEAFERSDMKKFKLTGLGWQTVAKRVEHDVNSIPLGYLSHREENAPLLRILTPNFLKLNAGSNRSPSTLFSQPTSSSDVMKQIEDAYKTFYKVWNDSYVPLIAKNQRWFHGDEDLRENDVVYFKLRDSVLSSQWLIGKVEQIIISKDNRVRKILVGYKFDTEQGERQFRTVERPVRECVKLLNMDDTTLLEDIQAVRDASQFLINGDDDPSQAVSNAAVHGSFPMVTYGCNQISSIDPVLSSAAVDIGTHAISVNLDSLSHGMDETMVGRDERDMKMNNDYNDEFFMINDTDINDKIYDDEYLLLL